MTQAPKYTKPDIKDLKLRFFLPHGDTGVHSMLLKRGHSVVFSTKQKFDIALFTGGADVHPFLYGEKVHAKTHFDLGRDYVDSAAFHKLDSDVPKVGICRGAQFLNVKSGGRLYQDVNKHALLEGHDAIDTTTSEVIKVTSTHHQMIRPSGDAFIMLEADESTTRATEGTSWYPAGYEEPDVEACFYYNSNSLCYQPHPEFPGYEACTNWFFDTIHNMFWQDVLKRRDIVYKKRWLSDVWSRIQRR